ncbi:MAG: hypothetical protein ACNFW9_04505 [Candidatus Kerfeldbacteria bacterium]
MNDELKKWLGEAKKNGLNNQQIFEQLKSQGYSEDNINKLLDNKSNSSNKQLSIIYRILYSIILSLLVLIFLIVGLSSGGRTYFFQEAFSEWYFIAVILIIPMIFNVSLGKRILIFIGTTIIFSIWGIFNSEGDDFAPLASFFIYNIFAFGVIFIGHKLFYKKFKKNILTIISIAIIILFIGVSLYTSLIINNKYIEYSEKIIYRELVCEGDLMSIEKFEKVCNMLSGTLNSNDIISSKDSCFKELDYYKNNNKVRPDFISSDGKFETQCNKFTMPLFFKYPEI